jgi:hypothetical protein
MRTRPFARIRILLAVVLLGGVLAGVSASAAFARSGGQSQRSALRCRAGVRRGHQVNARRSRNCGHAARKHRQHPAATQVATTPRHRRGTGAPRAKSASATVGNPPASATGTNAFGADMFGIASGGGIVAQPGALQAHELSLDHAAGAKWIRIDINWAQVQPNGPQSYDWSAIDSTIRGAEADGTNVLGVLVYSPAWARPAGTLMTSAPNAAEYGTFARAAAAHYGPMGVHAYEIWNEENTTAGWTPAPAPLVYADLLKAAYPAIHAADPSATVITGGLSPATTTQTSYSPTDFLRSIYAAGAGGDFDAVGAHPYCWPAQPGDPRTWSAWYQMYGTSVSLRSVMVANGDGSKRIWATEFGAPTGGPAGTFVTEAQQAQAVTTAYQLWSTYSWAGPLFVFQGRDQGTDTSSYYNFFGLTSYTGVPKPAYAAYQNAVATF